MSLRHRFLVLTSVGLNAPAAFGDCQGFAHSLLRLRHSLH
jgi:hypothetical protein